MSLDSKSMGCRDFIKVHNSVLSVITPAQARARKNPNKAFTLESTCGGGKFYLRDALQPHFRSNHGRGSFLGE
jgi:hypothetical protein